MDVDSIPLYNPSLILEWDSMKASGAVLWPNFDSGRTEAVSFRIIRAAIKTSIHFYCSVSIHIWSYI